MNTLSEIPVYLKASKLRQDLFKMLDLCVEDQKTIWIERGKNVFRLESVSAKKKLGTVAKRGHIIANSDGLAEFSPSQWSSDDIS